MQGELSHCQTICEGYKSQLQHVQDQMVMELDDRERMMDRLRAENEKFKVRTMDWGTVSLVLCLELCYIIVLHITSLRLV